MQVPKDDEAAGRWRIYPSTYAALGLAVAVAVFHAWSYDGDAVRVPLPEVWVDALEDSEDVAMVVGPKVATLCALGPYQDPSALPNDVRGARSGSPSQVDEGRVRIVLLAADGTFLAEADRKSVGPAPTVDVSDPGWCAPVSQVRLEPSPGQDGTGSGVVLVRENG